MTGLSAQELAQIRDTLAAGKRPKVMFTAAAGQIAGQTGQVIQLDDPALHDEWILVKFGGDALPFAPADLSIPPKTVSPRKADAVVVPPAPEPEFMLDKPIARQERSVSESPVESTEAVQATPGPRKPAAAKTAKVKAPPGLTVTIAFTDGEWTVGAVQGTKALAKPYVIKGAEALQMVTMLDVPGVQEAVELILASERAEALSQAERLRAELAELEAKLAELG